MRQITLFIALLCCAVLLAGVGLLAPMRSHVLAAGQVIYMPWAAYNDTVPLNPVPAPDVLQGGPVQMAQQGGRDWYLLPDGRMVAGSANVIAGAEPFPLDPSLAIRSIARRSGELVAATDKDLYRRDPITFRWEQFRDLDVRFVTFFAAKVWIVPN